MQRIGFVGLGNMGFPMASNLVKRGFEVAGFDVVDKALERAAKVGISVADSPMEAASGADAVILMLPSSEHVEEAIAGPEGVLRSLQTGDVILDMSTIDPGTTRRLAVEAASHGIEMLDAPVSRGQAAAVQGQLIIMVGGDVKTLQKCRPILDVLGTDIYHVGEVGSGEVTKLVNNLIVGVVVPAIAEALVFGVKAGVELERLIEVLTNASGNSWALQNFFPKAFSGDFDPGFFVDHMHKDLGLALEYSAEARVPMMLAPVAREMFEMARAKGYGEKDFTSVLLVLEELAQIVVRSRDHEQSPGAS